MCKATIYRYIVLIVSVMFLFSCKLKTQPDVIEIKKELTKEEKLRLEEKTIEHEIKTRLTGKADSALVFCKENGLNTELCFLVDMSAHSGKNRFFVWDFAKKEAVFSGLCCHGYGMGSSETEPVFSNKPGSYCTSLGKYKTGARSYSNWGINVHYKLHGLEKTNNNAFRRIVVLHSYSQVPAYEIYPAHLPLGYSQGCPVIDDFLMAEIDNLLKKTKKPFLLWIYNS